MLENAPNQPDFNPYEPEPLRSLQRPFQHEVAKHGIDASPEEAHKLIEQKFEYDVKLWMQQELAEQGVYVSPEEAPNLLMQKMLHGFKRQYQQELAEHGIDVSPDEALAIQELRILHLIMKLTDTTDPHEAT